MLKPRCRLRVLKLVASDTHLQSLVERELFMWCLCWSYGRGRGKVALWKSEVLKSRYVHKNTNLAISGEGVAIWNSEVKICSKMLSLHSKAEWGTPPPPPSKAGRRYPSCPRMDGATPAPGRDGATPPVQDNRWEYLIRRGRYASCVYTGGLSCVPTKIEVWERVKDK